tara:strand:- start:1475 stop:2254 length:780 start_codon:yes stop_codon:yes gene_type:complete
MSLPINELVTKVRTTRIKTILSNVFQSISGGGGSGTVTSVAALTLGTSGTDLSSTVANGTTTPVITLNVPTASAVNRGALSTTDWTTFNGKQAALGFTPSRRILYKNNVSSSTTGNTNENIMDSVLIPSGTLAANDILNFVIVTTKGGTAAGMTARLKANATAVLAGATTISTTSATAATVLWMKIGKEMVFKNSLASQFVFAATLTNPSSDIRNDITTAGTSLTIDFTVDQYLIVSLQVLNGADTGSLSSWYIEVIRT